MSNVKINQITNSKSQITNKSQSSNSKHYDLEERTFSFSLRIIKLCQALPKNEVNRRLVDQLIRSGTSVGANYREANETETKKDFKNRMRIARKEAKETVYWLKLIIEANPQFRTKMKNILQESLEILKILAAILEKCK